MYKIIFSFLFLIIIFTGNGKRKPNALAFWMNFAIKL